MINSPEDLVDCVFSTFHSGKNRKIFFKVIAVVFNCDDDAHFNYSWLYCKSNGDYTNDMTVKITVSLKGIFLKDFLDTYSLVRSELTMYDDLIKLLYNDEMIT